MYSQCHTKRRIGRALPENPSFGNDKDLNRHVFAASDSNINESSIQIIRNKLPQSSSRGHNNILHVIIICEYGHSLFYKYTELDSRTNVEWLIQPSPKQISLHCQFWLYQIRAPTRAHPQLLFTCAFLPWSFMSFG